MPSRDRFTRVSERLGLDVLSNPFQPCLTDRVDVVTLVPLKPVPTGTMPVSSSHDRASTLQALHETGDGRGWMQAQQQVYVGRDNPDGKQLAALLPCDGSKERHQEARDAAIDKCRSIPCGPAEVDVDAMTHLPKLLRFHPAHVTINTRGDSSLNQPVASAT